MTTQQALQQSIQNRRNKLAGDAAELTALRYIASLGLPVAHLETPWRVQRVGRRIVNATQMRPVLADLVSCLPDGRMIIVETSQDVTLGLAESAAKAAALIDLTGKLQRHPWDQSLWLELDSPEATELGHAQELSSFDIWEAAKLCCVPFTEKPKHWRLS